MFSQYTPPSMEEAIRMGVQGINPTGPNLALATHGIASQLITQLADGSKKLNMTNTLRMAWVAGSAVVGAILLQDAKSKTDSALDAKDRQNASAAAPGMPPEDPEKKDIPSGGIQISNKNLYKKGNVRIDVENPNPLQRPGQIHTQDTKGQKFYYDHIRKVFYDKNTKELAARGTQDLLKDPEVTKAIHKGLKILGLIQ